jgi:hypothetical protein
MDLRVLQSALALLILDLLIIGFIFGFGAFLLVCGVFAGILWAYHRLVLQWQPATWQWERFGSAWVRLEVV